MKFHAIEKVIEIRHSVLPTFQILIQKNYDFVRLTEDTDTVKSKL